MQELVSAKVRKPHWDWDWNSDSDSDWESLFDSMRGEGGWVSLGWVPSWAGVEHALNEIIM